MTVRHDAEVRALESTCDMFRTQFVRLAGESAELAATLAAVSAERDVLKAERDALKPPAKEPAPPEPVTP